MRELFSYWRDEIARNWIVAAVLLVWSVTASFNARMGYEIGGGFDEAPASLLYGAMFVGLAALGAYGFAQAGRHEGAMKGALLAVGCVALAVGLQAGFQSLGLTLSKGAAGMESKASTRLTATDALARARRERETLGVQRPIASIEALERLECAKTSPRYRDGVGPECTKLRDELGQAKKARDLDAQIPKLNADLGAAPKIKDAAANYEVAIAIGSGLRSWWSGKPAPITPDDARFGFLVFMVVVLELIGVLGFWIAGVHGEGRAHSLGAAAVFDDPGDTRSARRPPGYGYAGQGAYASAAPGMPLDFGQRRLLPPPPYRTPLAAPQSPAAGATPADDQGAASGYMGASVHGAPIHINIGNPAAPQSAGPGPAAPSDWPRGEPREPRPRQPRPDLNAASDPPPADRLPVRALLDGLVGFRAACVADAPGALVAGDDMFRRYQSWAGERAIPRTLFEVAFPDAAGIEVAEIGGGRMYRNCALKAGARLEAVA